jgi:hypothetical protein
MLESAARRPSVLRQDLESLAPGVKSAGERLTKRSTMVEEEVGRAEEKEGSWRRKRWVARSRSRGRGGRGGAQ